jgi:hypothetical protein
VSFKNLGHFIYQSCGIEFILDGPFNNVHEIRNDDLLLFSLFHF